jgi:hypothetical protein
VKRITNTTTRTAAPAPEPRATVRLVRCAIYTRKSSEEGLEQEFNSLDAQREAGEAYARSQAGEGWAWSANGRVIPAAGVAGCARGHSGQWHVATQKNRDSHGERR